MNGAIFYSSKRGSTVQYAQWIGEAIGLPVFDANNTQADPADCDFLIVGSSVIFMKMTIRKWVRANWDRIMQQSNVFLSGHWAERESLVVIIDFRNRRVMS